MELPKDRWPDWIMLQTQGRGRFCGVTLHVWNPARRLVGRRRREVLRRRREIPLHLRHRLGRLFRLRLGQSAPVPETLSRPNDDPKQQGPSVAAPLAHRRQRALPEVVRGLHREVLQKRPGHALRLHGPVVSRSRRQRSLRHGARRAARRLLQSARSGRRRFQGAQHA